MRLELRTRRSREKPGASGNRYVHFDLVDSDSVFSCSNDQADDEAHHGRRAFRVRAADPVQKWPGVRSRDGGKSRPVNVRLPGMKDDVFADERTVVMAYVIRVQL